MSKNIIIQEGGVGKQLTADKLKTNLVGGGACLWVPEDETQLGTKYISENGTYRANDDGYYGYSEVTVSGIGSVTGKNPATGQEVVVTKDPVTGEIVETVVPVEIHVIEPPTITGGVYVDGQTITKDGMVVKAYLQSGGEYGVVPNSEITLDPSVAHYDPDAEYIIVHDDIDGWPNPFSSCGTLEIYEEGENPWIRHRYVFSTTSTAILLNNGQDWRAIIADESNRHGATHYEYSVSDHSEVVQTTEYYTRVEYTKNGKTVYYSIITGSARRIQGIPNSGSGGNYENVAWELIYGENREIHSGPEIKVKWPRPGDGKVLETSFEILVAPGYTPGDGE